MSLASLWLPIVLSTVFCFLASTLIWMVFQLHRNDWAKLPDEEALAAALNGQKAAPGEYHFPHATGPQEWKSEAFQERFKRGPVGFLTLMPPGQMAMGKNMALWIVYLVVIEVFVAYLAGRTLAAGADYLRVFQVVGTTAILAFAGGVAPQAIWMGRRWANVGREIVDGVVYGLLTAGTFGWLWPAG